MTHDDGHPTVDCSVLLSRDLHHPRRKATLSRIRDALETRGYFYASNVASLPANYIAEAPHISRHKRDA